MCDRDAVHAANSFVSWIGQRFFFFFQSHVCHLALPDPCTRSPAKMSTTNAVLTHVKRTPCFKELCILVKNVSILDESFAEKIKNQQREKTTYVNVLAEVGTFSLCSNTLRVFYTYKDQDKQYCVFTVMCYMHVCADPPTCCMRVCARPAYVLQSHTLLFFFFLRVCVCARSHQKCAPKKVQSNAPVKPQKQASPKQERKPKQR